MSGSTLGAFAGAGIGFLIGGPAGAKWGWMIGSMIGGYVDPQKIEGPRLKDATTQTSQDGIPIPWGYGSFPTTGNLIWTDRLVETKSTKRQGKGGPKVTEYTYTRSYAVGVCEGEIAGYLIVKRNGKIVYDTRTNAELTALGYTSAQISESRAAQAKWQEVATLYYGSESQTPAATMVAVEGAGNVPAYRGLAYIVVTDEDLTNERGAVPQYEFVVSVCGTRTEAEGGMLLVTGQDNGSGFVFAESEADAVPVFVGIPTSTGADLSQASAGFYNNVWMAVETNETRYSVDNRATWQTGTMPFTLYPADLLAGGPDGWLTQNGERVFGQGYAKATPTGNFATAAYNRVISPSETGAVNYLTLIRYTGGYWYFDQDGCLCRSLSLATTDWDAVGGYRPDGIVWFHDVVEFNGDLYAAVTQYATSSRYQLRKWNGTDWNEILIDNSGGGAIRPLQLEVGGDILLVYCWGAQYVYTSEDGFATAHSTGIARDTAVEPVEDNIGRQIAFSNGHFYIISAGAYAPTPALGNKCVTTDDGLSFSAPISLPITSLKSIAASNPVVTSGTELPDAPGHYVDEDGVVNGPAGTVVDRCTPELGTDIVTDLCSRRGVTDIDVTELTDLVDGFKIATETDPASAIDSTRAAYFYDASEYDGIVHFPKRGGAVAFALTMDDLAARDGDPIEWERVQEAELLRKVTVAYIDPATTYTATTQKWERRTGTVEAKGEGSVEIPLTGTKDFAAQVAEKRGKVAWAETDKCKFSLPYKWAKLTPADVGTLTDALGKVHRIRILSIEDDSGYRHVEAVREQTNTYVSTAVGSSGPNPTYPGSGLAGPTVAAIMNLPVLRDTDDKAGVYVAAAGMLSGWQGALIQMARDGATYENGPIIAANATMGSLTATLPTASRYAQDNTNTLSVSLLPTSGDLSSTTYQGLIEEENVCAILYTDGTAEILQFQTATETAPGVYGLTGLMRGRQDTTIASHAIGARFVLLDDAIRFTAIKPSDVGRTLTFRPVSVGSSPASNATQTITMTTIQSLREWSPYNVTVEWDGVEVGAGEGAGYCVEWIGRARLGSSRTPVHSQWFAGYRVTFTVEGVTYEVDTTEQGYCADAAELMAAFPGGYGQPVVTVRALSRVATNDDDFSSPPSAPSTSPPSTTPNGVPGSTTTGTYGGFADDAPHPTPEPTVFGTDVVGTPGAFADTAALAEWTATNGGPLSAEWTVETGRARFQGVQSQNSYAYYRPAILRMGNLPMPRYTVTITADVQTANGGLAYIGTDNANHSTATAYPVSTAVSYSYDYEMQSPGVTGQGVYVIPTVLPVLGVQSSTGGVVTAWFDNITVTVVENTYATTAFVPANIAFPANDLTGWVTFAGSYTETFSGGEMSAAVSGAAGYTRYYINTDPITTADTVGEYIRIAAEVWSNDPTVVNGVTKNGVALGIAVYDGANYNYVAYAHVFQRGDWTAREWWQRVTTVGAGVTYHAMFAVKGAPTYTQKIRNITVEVTDVAVD